MKKISSTLTQLLSSRGFSLVIVFISLTVRIINILFVSHVGGDKIMVAAMSRNFLRGNGMAIPEYFVSNVGTPIYNFAPLWPVGYTLTLAGFLKLFNYNLFWSFTAIDLVAGVIFVIIIRKFFILLECTGPVINIATLVAGCFDYTFISGSLPTDFITVTLVLLGFWLVMKSLKNEQVNKKQLITASFFLILPCFFRYSYHLAIAGIPILILLIAYFSKDQVAFKKGKIILLFSIIFYMLMAAVQYSLSGSLLYILKTEKGLYPQSVVHWSPFIPMAFASPNFYYVKFFSRVISEGFYNLMLEVFNILSFMLLVAGFYNYLKKVRFASPISISRWFLFIGTGISAGVLLLLAYVSLTNKDQSFHNIPWNYINEHRYFAFVVIFIQMVFLVWCFSGIGIPVKNYFLRAIRFLLATLLIIEIVHSIYFNSLLPFRYTELKMARYWENRMAFLVNTVSDFIKENKNKEILVGDYYPGANDLGSFYGKKGLMDCLELNKKLPAVKQKTLLLLHLTDDQLPEFKEFFTRTNPLLYKKFEYNNFYLLELLP